MKAVISMKNSILIEHLLPHESNIICESSRDGSGNVWLKGIIMQGGIKNRNGRIYPVNEISNAVRSLNESIKTYGSCLGELGHPQNLEVNLDRVSHTITEIWMDGNNAVGKLKLLDTPMGKIAKEIVKAGVRLGISSRGAGEVVNETVTGFMATTADLVSVPSAPSAMLSLSESALVTNDTTKLLSLAESLQHDKSAQKYFDKEITKFIEKLLK